MVNVLDSRASGISSVFDTDDLNEASVLVAKVAGRSASILD